MTDDQLHAIMPRVPAAKRTKLLPFLQTALTEFQINSPAREAAFIAQLAHESGQFRFMEEIWGPTDAQRRYEPTSTLATKLGNTQPGDGKRFKGRGPIQITGRANYDRFGGLLGVDLIADPAAAALPHLSFRIAGLFWMKKGLNELADQVSAEAFREITKRINGGFNGLADREAFYAVSRATLGVVPPPVSRGGGATVADVPPEPAFNRGYESLREEGIEEGIREVPREEAVPEEAPRRVPVTRKPRKKAAPRKPTRKPAGARRVAAAKAPRRKATRKRVARPGTKRRKR
jgi:putative chitinase